MKKREQEKEEPSPVRCSMKVYGFNRYSRICRDCMWALGTSNCPVMTKDEIAMEWRRKRGNGGYLYLKAE